MTRRIISALATTLVVLTLLTSTTGVTLAGVDDKQQPSRAGLPGRPEDGVGTGFTYQGSLKDGGNPANGQYDLQFTLYDALTGGNQAGSPIVMAGQTVTNGLFAVQLDFGPSAFQGSSRWLEIAVRPAGGGSFTTLSPRQPLTPAPYALSLAPGAVITGSVPLGSAVVSGFSTGDGNGLYGNSNATNQAGVVGENANGFGVIGNGYTGVSGNGFLGDGVRGATTYGNGGDFTSLTGDGVHAGSNDSDGGFFTSGTGDGVYGQSDQGKGGYFVSTSGNGVYAESANTDGIVGTSTFTNSVGVAGVDNKGYGVSASGITGVLATGTSGDGVSATTTSGRGGSFTSNTNIGVYGASTSNAGVYGTSNTFVGGYFVSNGSPAVYGQSNALGGYFTSAGSNGVYGRSTGADGIIGLSTYTNTAGVHGTDLLGYGIVGAGLTGVAGSGTTGDGVVGTTFSGKGGNFTSTIGHGVEGQSTTGLGGYFTSANSSAIGAQVNNGSPSISATNTGTGRGVVGQSDVSDGVQGLSTSGTGVSGSSGGSNAGVYGSSVGGRGTYGVSTNGEGAYGYSTANNKGGVLGENSNGFGVIGNGYTGVSGIGTDGDGVRGATTNGNGGSFASTNGVAGYFTSTNGIAILGILNNDNQSITGINNGAGLGVAGESVGGLGGYFSGVNGVEGLATGTSAVASVEGLNPSTNCSTCWSGYFQSNVNVDGTLYANSKAFKIDDPLDPANKYLIHTSVESPDMLDIYRGHVTLDAQGTAWVQMPDYFQALNMDFDYQLTPVGASQPNLYVAQEIKDNKFQIGGGVPGAKVSWQVTGVRHDPYADTYRTPVEQQKTPQEQGLYMHPELYNQPPSKAVSTIYKQSSPQQPLPTPTGNK